MKFALNINPVRGAAMVEYALLIVAVMFVGAYAYKHMGASVLENGRLSGQQLENR